VEPNHGQVFSVTRKGVINQVIDISASEGHIVPTAIAEREGDFYVGNLNLFPIDPQWARILTISKQPSTENVPPGFDRNRFGYHIVESTAGFTTVVAVDFGPGGLLYVLELSDTVGFPNPRFVIYRISSLCSHRRRRSQIRQRYSALYHRLAHVDQGVKYGK
jgi:hypothetical protein